MNESLTSIGLGAPGIQGDAFRPIARRYSRALEPSGRTPATGAPPASALYENDHDYLIRCEERSRIGRDLHDSTAQLLVALQLQLIEMRAAVCAPQRRDVICEVEETISRLHHEIRTVALVQQLPVLGTCSLPDALTAMAQDFSKLTGLYISVELTGKYVARSAAFESSLYRIVQESLANVQRHSKADRARIRLQSKPGSLRMSIQDDGVGIPTRSRQFPTSGLGLLSISRRAREMGGKLTVRRLKTGTLISFICKLS